MAATCRHWRKTLLPKIFAEAVVYPQIDALLKREEIPPTILPAIRHLTFGIHFPDVDSHEGSYQRLCELYDLLDTLHSKSVTFLRLENFEINVTWGRDDNYIFSHGDDIFRAIFNQGPWKQIARLIRLIFRNHMVSPNFILKFVSKDSEPCRMMNIEALECIGSAFKHFPNLEIQFVGFGLEASPYKFTKIKRILEALPPNTSLSLIQLKSGVPFTTYAIGRLRILHLDTEFDSRTLYKTLEHAWAPIFDKCTWTHRRYPIGRY